ncbi:zinc/manganese transport system substrate-binding protein [Actinopolyspora xinjiangensis]|uniref:Zinc/manganese transport system substrate-binding protein n=1 Tax=Actinopolyspora xinjiangensis TaxID=405564 RepID=A0A1H0PF62_9ACTN|nr:zinc ABC transporter substrate-binding protein [Actinopolyspora xinjiangensis]SDP03643.1 zinc/manganese transport system substrate-binding protein [Actinopolyspora xinjiangensis]
MNTPRSCHPGHTGRSPRPGGVTALAGLAATALLLTACGGPGDTSEDGKLTVVASTDMWASVARAVAGEDAEVEAIIDGDEADPHSYESTPRDAARLDNADLVVHNGGGYDSFAGQLLADSDSAPPDVEAVKVAESDGTDEGSATAEPHQHEGSGHGHHHSGNEHVWYDPHTVQLVADRIADRLGEISPDRSREFQRSATEFGDTLDGIQRNITELREAHHGTEVMTTAPVADHLLDDAGLTDITPSSFVRSVEAGNDPAAATVAELQELVDSGRPAALIDNPQTASPLTERVTERARNNGIPVVAMPETLPGDRPYAEWLSGRVSALRTALETDTSGSEGR